MAVILVAEPNAMDRMLLRSLLEDEGHAVITANDGAAAASLTWSARPDLVLLDADLPLLDGPALAALLRRTVELKHTALVALSGHGSPAIRGRCLEAGCDDFDTKPVDEERLLEKLNRALSVRPDHAPAERRAPGELQRAQRDLEGPAARPAQDPQVDVLRAQIEAKDHQIRRLERALDLLQSALRRALDATWQEMVVNLNPNPMAPGPSGGEHDPRRIP